MQVHLHLSLELTSLLFRRRDGRHELDSNPGLHTAELHGQFCATPGTKAMSLGGGGGGGYAELEGSGSKFSCPDEFRMSESRKKKIICLLSGKMDNCCEVLTKLIGKATTNLCS
jgi:hypothetical protein